MMGIPFNEEEQNRLKIHAKQLSTPYWEESGLVLVLKLLKTVIGISMFGCEAHALRMIFFLD